MSVLNSILSGAIGGFAATSLGTIAVQWYKRPSLEFNEGIVKRGSSPYEERAETAEHNVQIRNTGRSVATNCKARIYFEGVHETTVKEPFMVQEGVEYEEVETTKKYTIEISPEWSEIGSPDRIDINQGEHASFRLFEADRDSIGPHSHNKIRFGSVLSEEEMEKHDRIHSEPIRVETPSHRMDTEPSVRYKSSINRETFSEIDWKVKEVVVTSAESTKLQSGIELAWEEGSLPNVSLR